eukprot:TRINITY_DN20204_c0_g1_i1.p1 TRINITY_DN20204_c0_g1~~TRINITY_DN20204_c0_g1_i1.p1  ORF type:complete len:687 (+),score=115.53 TRINITY_DN20204_c0_g1_i1:2-2062(+)
MSRPRPGLAALRVRPMTWTKAALAENARKLRASDGMAGVASCGPLLAGPLNPPLAIAPLPMSVPQAGGPYSSRSLARSLAAPAGSAPSAAQAAGRVVPQLRTGPSCSSLPGTAASPQAGLPVRAAPSAPGAAISAAPSSPVARTALLPASPGAQVTPAAAASGAAAALSRMASAGRAGNAGGLQVSTAATSGTASAKVLRHHASAAALRPPGSPSVPRLQQTPASARRADGATASVTGAGPLLDDHVLGPSLSSARAAAPAGGATANGAGSAPWPQRAAASAGVRTARQQQQFAVAGVAAKGSAGVGGTVAGGYPRVGPSALRPTPLQRLGTMASAPPAAGAASSSSSRYPMQGAGAALAPARHRSCAGFQLASGAQGSGASLALFRRQGSDSSELTASPTAKLSQAPSRGIMRLNLPESPEPTSPTSPCECDGIRTRSPRAPVALLWGRGHLEDPACAGVSPQRLNARAIQFYGDRTRSPPAPAAAAMVPTRTDSPPPAEDHSDSECTQSPRSLVAVFEGERTRSPMLAPVAARASRDIAGAVLSQEVCSPAAEMPVVQPATAVAEADPVARRLDVSASDDQAACSEQRAGEGEAKRPPAPAPPPFDEEQRRSPRTFEVLWGSWKTWFGRGHSTATTAGTSVAYATAPAPTPAPQAAPAVPASPAPAADGAAMAERLLQAEERRS